MGCQMFNRRQDLVNSLTFNTNSQIYNSYKSVNNDIF